MTFLGIPEHTDRTLACKECGAAFVFSAGEQKFYRDRNIQNEPKRCKPCRDARRLNGSSPDNGNHRPGTQGQRVETSVTCGQCGARCTVPFVPSQGRPVLCNSCFNPTR